MKTSTKNASKHTSNTSYLWLTFIAITLFSYITFAQSLKTNLSESTIDGVKLASSTQYDDGSTQAELKAYSTGSRFKKVFGLVTVKVYHAELLLAKPENLKKEDDQTLNSLKSSGPLQLRLIMLRDLKGQQISDSFKEALSAYNINEDQYATELKEIFKEISEIKEFKTGQIFSIAANWSSQKATLLVQKPDGKILKYSGDENFANQLFQIWFGKTQDNKKIDPKLVDLKKELLKI